MIEDLVSDVMQELKWQKVLPALLASHSMKYKFKYEATHCHLKGLSDKRWLTSFSQNPMVSGYPGTDILGLWECRVETVALKPE